MVKHIGIILILASLAGPSLAVARDNAPAGCYLKLTRTGTQQCCYTGEGYEVKCRPLPNTVRDPL